jgi:hypothetical protein
MSAAAAAEATCLLVDVLVVRAANSDNSAKARPLRCHPRWDSPVGTRVVRPGPARQPHANALASGSADRSIITVNPPS